MKSEYQNNIIAKIRKLRVEHKYSQKEMAEVLGVSNGHIGNIESPKREHKYTLCQIGKICEELGCTIEQIFLEDTDYHDGQDILKSVIDKIIKYEE